MIKAIAENYSGHSFKPGILFSGFAFQSVKAGVSLSAAQGSGVKRTLTLCKTIESIGTFLTSAPNGSWMHVPEGYTFSYFTILSPELSDLMAAQ